MLRNNVASSSRGIAGRQQRPLKLEGCFAEACEFLYLSGRYRIRMTLEVCAGHNEKRVCGCMWLFDLPAASELRKEDRERSASEGAATTR
jgi:hypothetical protein